MTSAEPVDPPAATRTPPRGRAARGLARVGAAWSLLFAVAHFYWAAGGRIGVAGSAGPITRRPWFLAYDLAAGIVFIAAAGIGFVLARGRAGDRSLRRLLTATAWGAGLALLRGCGGLVEDAVVAVTGQAPGVGMLYDAWFAVVGVVFCLAVRGIRRHEATTSGVRGPDALGWSDSGDGGDPLRRGDQRVRRGTFGPVGDRLFGAR